MSDSQTLFPDAPSWRLWLLGFLLVSALGVRLINLTDPPLDFHPTRQYRSALLARAYFLESQPSLPDWRRDVIKSQQEDIGLLEPPLFEWIVSQSYRGIGFEALWIPRLYSIFFWLCASVFVFLICRRLGSLDFAVLATAFFLFSPFGIQASRSFQPDILMLMFLTWSLYLLLNYQESPDTKRLYLAAAISGLTILVKPQGIFMLFTTALALIGFRDNRKRLHLMLFLVIASIPGMLYYGYKFLSEPTLQNQLSGSFLPQLWVELYYWQFWFKHIWRVIGFSALTGGLFGILLMPADWRRRFVIALWLGYFIFGLFYNYHIHTHDYYHLQFILAVAPALGFLGAVVLQQLVLINQGRLGRVVIGGLLLFSMFLNTGLYLNTLFETDAPESHVQLAEHIGSLVRHSTRTLFLAPYYGQPLSYHGELAGSAWPTVGDMRAEQLWGVQAMSAEARLSRFLQDVPAEYFIVTDMAEYEAQIELKSLLTSHYPILAQSKDFLIFDLRPNE